MIKRFIKIFILSLIILFFSISLYTFSPLDPGIGVVSKEGVKNWGGLLGAYLSSLFVFLFGINSIIIPPFLFWLLWRVYKKNPIFSQIFYFLLFLVITSFVSTQFFAWLNIKNLNLFQKFPLHGGFVGELSNVLISIIGIPGFLLLVIGFLSIFIFKIISTKKIFTKKEDSKEFSSEMFLKNNASVNIENISAENIHKNKELSKPEVSKIETEKKQEVKKLPPPLDLLSEPKGSVVIRQEELKERALLLVSKLKEFNIDGEIVNINPGPVITVYEFKPAPGIKIGKIVNLVDDLALGLSAKSVRIVAPIPGKNVIGIEVSNPKREWVYLKEIIKSKNFINSPSPLTMALGKDILGNPVVADLKKMPHLLIAGSTGSGKSIFLHSIIISFIYKSTPEQVRFLMVDPKRIELSVYEKIPYLLHPVVCEPKFATKMLRWLIKEMERRYNLFEEKGVRNIDSHNETFEEKIPHIVLIIDELADLMVVSSKEVETYLTRLAQMARAAGIHLIVATQRPSVDVITGLIKANFPARISFQVTSKVDSRTILDVQGAERLLGAGDMLFLPPGSSHLQRIHGPYVSEKEIKQIVEYLRACGEPQYITEIEAMEEETDTISATFQDEEDELYKEAVKIAYQYGKISVSMLQRKLRIGYNRAARLVEKMEEEGIVGPSDGVRPRPVIRTPQSF